MKRTLFFFLSLTFLFAAFTNIAGQDNDALKQKIKSLKGEAESITIKTDEGELTLTGEEAETLFKRIKSYSKDFDFEILTSSDDDDVQVFTVKMDKDGKEDSDKVMVFVTSDDDENFEWNGDFSEIEDGRNKNIEIEITDDGKKVTVTTEKDGEKDVKVYEGEEAEEFLEKNKAERIELKKIKGAKKIFIKKEIKKDDDDK